MDLFSLGFDPVKRHFGKGIVYRVNETTVSSKWNQRVTKNPIHSTTSTTDTSTTDSTRITNAMATSSDYLMKYFNGFLAVLLE